LTLFVENGKFKLAVLHRFRFCMLLIRKNFLSLDE